LWGSIFSRSADSLRARLQRIYSRITVRVGAPVPAHQASPEYLQQCVAELRGHSK
jgi:hypothetical protein